MKTKKKTSKPKLSTLSLTILALLIGLLTTVSTTKATGHRGGVAVKNCGFSFSSRTNKRTALSECLLTDYGWPIRYVHSGVEAILRDYHTISPNEPANASSIIGYSSFSRLSFLADWVIWSTASEIFILVVSSSRSKLLKIN